MNDKEALTIIRNNLFILYKQGSLEVGVPLVKAIDYVCTRMTYVDGIELDTTREIWAVSQAIERAAKEVHNGDDDQ